MPRKRPLGPDGTIWCPACAAFRQQEEFNKSRNEGQPRAYCRHCEAKWLERRRRAHGIPPAWRRPADQAGERWCFRCRAYKAISEFGKSKTYCLVCLAAFAAKWAGGYKRGPRGRVIRQPPMESGVAICTKCGMTKPRTEFYRRVLATNGLMAWCKGCCKAQAQRHPEIPQRTAAMYRRALRVEVLAAYGNRCRCCGINESVFLCVDHIDGGGATHFRQIGGPDKFYQWLKRNGFPSGFQLLCRNCNFAKHMGGCPHQRSPEAAVPSTES